MATQIFTRMSKQYGLVIPGQQKKATVTREISRPSIFNDSDAEEDEAPLLKMKNAPVEPSAMVRRLARQQQEKALEEDPTIFQYDEVYEDQVESKKKEAGSNTKTSEPKKPKYIARLMESAERRKLENERRIERQVQKEREEEGEEFKDKESFVTSSYRKKLEDLRKLEDNEKREEYLEKIGDVTKQKDLDGFYRHLYEQKLGINKPETLSKPPVSTLPEPLSDALEVKETEKTNLKKQLRAYRKRRSSEEEEDLEKSQSLLQSSKKAHLENHIDADSDFSIDSSTSDDDDDDDNDNDDNNQKMANKKLKEQKTLTNSKKNPSNATLAITDKTVSVAKEGGPANKIESCTEISTAQLRNDTPASAPSPPPPPPKKDKEAIWRKRTVDEAFDAAVKRYFQRKAARNA